MSKRAELRMAWSKRERDWLFHFDKQKADGHWLNSFVTYGAAGVLHLDPIIGEPTSKLREELAKRGYDPDTFTISVRRTKDAP